MEKLTTECIPYTGPVFVVGAGYKPEILPSSKEVEALEDALIRWHRLVSDRYGSSRGFASWRRACKIVIDFERGE